MTDEEKDMLEQCAVILEGDGREPGAEAVRRAVQWIGELELNRAAMIEQRGVYDHQLELLEAENKRLRDRVGEFWEKVDDDPRRT